VGKDDIHLQVDLRHTQKGENEDEKPEDVIAELKDVLPERNGDPYLSAFLLTHPDEDHCSGFERLLDEVEIGEILHTPQIFEQYEDDDELCDDAKAFRDECQRRRDRSIEVEGDPGSGDRVLVIGYADTFEESEYEDLPEEFRVVAGDTITKIDGEELEDAELFIHGPLKGEYGNDRNDASLSFQLRLESADGQESLECLFLGDRSSEKIESIIDETENHDNHGRLDWNVLLAPHHCSKWALYTKEDGTEQSHDDVVKALRDGAREVSYVVASCMAVDDDGDSAFTDGENDDPPHQKARDRYYTMLDEEEDFLCTGEHPSTDDPTALVIQLNDGGIEVESEGGGDDGGEGDGGEDSSAPPPPGWGSESSRSTSSESIDHGC
jgi:hypothetical protein